MGEFNFFGGGYSWWSFSVWFGYYFFNVLAYRLVASKLAIIFQFMILNAENPKLRFHHKFRNERYAVLTVVFNY